MNRLSMCGLVLGLSVAVAFAGDDKAKRMTAKIGHPAPSFTAETFDGKTVKLEDYKGKIVVLEQFNHDCPVCDKHVQAKTIIDLVKKYEDVVFLGVDSTYRHRNSEGSVKDYIKNNKVNYPILKDFEGKIGHMYGAKTTPHMFVIDTKGVLQYDGAIDDAKSGDGKLNYVDAAIRQLKAGETVAHSKTTPYGCSVKYKKSKKKGRG